MILTVFVFCVLIIIKSQSTDNKVLLFKVWLTKTKLKLGQRFKLKLSVGQMSPHALIGQLSVGQMSVGQMSVGQVSRILEFHMEEINFFWAHGRTGKKSISSRRKRQNVEEMGRE